MIQQSSIHTAYSRQIHPQGPDFFYSQLSIQRNTHTFSLMKKSAEVK